MLYLSGGAKPKPWYNSEIDGARGKVPPQSETAKDKPFNLVKSLARNLQCIFQDFYSVIFADFFWSNTAAASNFAVACYFARTSNFVAASKFNVGFCCRKHAAGSNNYENSSMRIAISITIKGQLVHDQCISSGRWLFTQIWKVLAFPWNFRALLPVRVGSFCGHSISRSQWLIQVSIMPM